jgi:hypothetical protein
MMKPRLLILIVAAAGLAVYFASLKSRPVSTKVDAPDESILSDEERKQIDLTQKMLDTFPLSGKEPAEPADLSVLVEVDRSKGKNRLYFTISERHGYYVEQLKVRLWWKKGGVKEPKDSPLDAEQFFDRYLKANETLRLCMEVVPFELAKVGGDIGRTEDWGSEIAWHGRVRDKNPNPLPPDKDLGRCD